MIKKLFRLGSGALQASVHAENPKGQNSQKGYDKDSIISLRGITTAFGSHIVHKDLSLDIRQREILGLIGGSGSGKSVLLHTILGLLRQKSGSVSIMGVNTRTTSLKKRDAIRRQWGVLFQDGALFSSLTVGENIQFPLREFTSLRGNILEHIARMKIELVGLPQAAYALFPGELSGGMRKRAGLARALALDPAILLLDEPTAGLDPLGANAFDELILTLRASMGLTVVMVTHDLDSLYTICDRVAVLAEKHIYAVDTIQNLLKIDYPWIKEYFEGPRGCTALSKYAKDKE